MSLQRVYDPYFSKHSYGFRPGRSAQQAVEQASKYVSKADLGGGYRLGELFDKINHDRLMSRLRKSITDKRLLKLIHQFPQAGMMHGGLETQRIAGTPQGGPLSPLLSNIV
ncbi:MAG: reverse transcriptase domain-containing protein [Saprospiraceae bacterium]